tara:strand:- start:29 stop:466 length:438 start_codon:yes stop_codon:yes gene_type:complete
LKHITTYTALTIIVIFIGCVGPPDYDDGLLENVPAVVNDNDYFSISVLGDKYTELNEWNLEIDVDIEDEILTTLIIKDISIRSSDSSYIYLVDDQGDTMLDVGLFNDLVFTSQDSISLIGVPTKFIFNSDNFTGMIDYQIIKTSF